jgi:hypothetical protein
VVPVGFVANSSGAILIAQQIFAVFLKALEKQQEPALTDGFIAQNLSR